MVALGSDHGGFTIKEAIKDYFIQQKIPFKDFGTDNNESVDYPYFAQKVTSSINLGESEKGILCCGTGIGISIAANKVRGIRAAVCVDPFCAEMCRRHNNANIICLGGRVLDKEKAINLVKIFMDTPFEGGRHNKRLAQIEDIERNTNLK